MSYFKDFNSIPFILELRVKDMLTKTDSGDWIHHVDSSEVLEVAGKLKEIISKNHSDMQLSDFISISAQYLNKGEGPRIYGKTSPENFKNMFGYNIKSGLSMVFGPYPIPLEISRKWYQVGDLFIPDDMYKYTKNISLMRYAQGPFGEMDFFKPKGVKY